MMEKFEVEIGALRRKLRGVNLNKVAYKAICKCGESFGGTDSGTYPYPMAMDAHEKGWRVIDNEVKCPECVK